MNKKNFAPKLYPINRDTSKVWFVKWTDINGKVIKVYGILNHLPTIEEREIEAKRLIENIYNPPNYTPVENANSYNLLQLLSKLLETKRPLMRIKSYYNYDGILSEFARWYKLIKTKEMREIEFFAHLATKGLHKNTIRNRHLILKGLCNELVQKRQLLTNPFLGIKLKKVKSTSKLPFSHPQTALLKQYFIDNNLQMLLAAEMSYYLFLRPNELRQLKIMDILFDEWKVCLSGTIAKDGDTIYKTVPLPLRTKLLPLKELPQNYFIFSENKLPGATELSRDFLSKTHKKYLTILNISSRYSFYSWVHTGIKNAALSNIPIKELQLQKGHHDLNMFNQYLKDLGVDDCKELVNNFPAM